MIPWNLSDWSTSDALAAVDLSHVPATNGRRAVLRGEDVEIVGTVTAVNEWLVASGQVEQWAVVL